MRHPYSANNAIVTIIIPVYNVERYIERCARSLYEQTYRHIEYIWVNDATPDESLDILKKVTEDYPNRKSQIQIITHAQNQGLPSARNTGLTIATGDYIFHCDSDDYVDKDMIRQFIHKAIDLSADIVYSDWYLSFHKRERYMKQPACEDGFTCIQAMLSGSMRFNVWNKLVRRSLYQENDIRFPPGKGMGEDMTMIRLFAYAENVAYLPKAYYHYMQVNPVAYTKVFSEDHWNQLQGNVSDIKAFLTTKYGERLNTELHLFCLNVKLPLLITGENSSYERWLTTYRESDAYIDTPQHRSFRIRWLQQMVLKRRFCLIRLHYCLVVKIIYGVIYR